MSDNRIGIKNIPHVVLSSHQPPMPQLVGSNSQPLQILIPLQQAPVTIPMQQVPASVPMQQTPISPMSATSNTNQTPSSKATTRRQLIHTTIPFLEFSNVFIPITIEHDKIIYDLNNCDKFVQNEIKNRLRVKTNVSGFDGVSIRATIESRLSRVTITSRQRLTLPIALALFTIDTATSLLNDDPGLALKLIELKYNHERQLQNQNNNNSQPQNAAKKINGIEHKINQKTKTISFTFTNSFESFATSELKTIQSKLSEINYLSVSHKGFTMDVVLPLINENMLTDELAENLCLLGSNAIRKLLDQLQNQSAIQNSALVSRSPSSTFFADLPQPQNSPTETQTNHGLQKHS